MFFDVVYFFCKHKMCHTDKSPNNCNSWGFNFLSGFFQKEKKLLTKINNYAVSCATLVFLGCDAAAY